MLKVDLHLHCNEDPVDPIKHSAKELIDHAASMSFDIISITCHNKVVYSQGLTEYAKEKGILLIPGIELDIEGRHVLLYNFTQEEADKIKTLNDLRLLKRKDQLVVAPHPYYVHLNPLDPRQISLFSRLEKNIDIFDAIEFSHLYTKQLNKPNKKAKEIAEKYNLPLIAGSDLHNLSHMGSNFSFVDAEKNMASIFKAIKNKEIIIYSRPREAKELRHILRFFAGMGIRKKLIKTKLPLLSKLA